MSQINYRYVAAEFIEHSTQGTETAYFYLAGREPALYVYQDRRYQYCTDTNLAHRIMAWAGNIKVLEYVLSDPARIFKVIQQVKALVAISAHPRCRSAESFGWVAPTDIERTHDWLAVANGVLDLTMAGRGEPVLVPHTDRWFSPIRIPTEYNPAAQCPVWDRALAEWTEGDAEIAALLGEFMGYTLLVGKMPYPQILVLEGPGSNGKTVFLRAVENVLGGEANVSCLSLDQFGSEYGLGTTRDKLLNIADETDATPGRITAHLKRYTGGSGIYVNTKYAQPTPNMKPTAKLVVSWNKAPDFGDTTDGWWRRILIVPFRHRYLDAQLRPLPGCDPHLVDKLLAEKSGILNWMLRGYARLAQQQRFTESAVVRERVLGFRETTDPVRTYLTERLAVDTSPDASVAKDVVWDDYRAWTTAQRGPKLLGRTEFWEHFRDVYPASREVRRGGMGRPRCMTGVRLVETPREA